VPFPFYRRLSKRGKAIYRKSDAIVDVPLPDVASLRALADAIEAALKKASAASPREDSGGAGAGAPLAARSPRSDADRIAVERTSAAFVAAIVKALRVGPVSVRVLARRPRNGYGELHGLYTREEGKQPVLQVWMRTAAHKRVVAYRTFLRTLLHEVGHHLDYELFDLEDSLHTEGFYRRESSMARQLLPARVREPEPEPEPETPAKPTQTSMPWG
jgi:hypothetical protein